MGGELGVPGAKPPSLGHSVQGGSGGLAPRFRLRRTRKVRGAEDPGLQVQGIQGGSGVCPRFGRLGYVS